MTNFTVTLASRRPWLVHEKIIMKELKCWQSPDCSLMKSTGCYVFIYRCLVSMATLLPISHGRVPKSCVFIMNFHFGFLWLIINLPGYHGLCTFAYMWGNWWVYICEASHEIAFILSTLYEAFEQHIIIYGNRCL